MDEEISPLLLLRFVSRGDEMGILYRLAILVDTFVGRNMQ